LLLMLAFLGFGFGIVISSLTVKYRDLNILISFAIGLWLYVTPVIYPLSVMTEKYSDYMWVLQANPLTSIIETFKCGFLGTGTFSWGALLYSVVFTVALTLWGIRIFNKTERNFVDIV
jgi:lipopolysaccharide transport system permease protein